MRREISRLCLITATTLLVTIYLKNIDADFAGMNKVWDQWLPKGAQPARATVEAKLCEPEILVELSVIAALP